MVLAFVTGILATIIKSDLKFPEGMYQGLTIYLLFAIGLKGGVKLSQTSLADFYKAGLSGIIMSCAIPFWAYYAFKKIARFDTINAAALAAHFGSVSAVTFSQSMVYMDTHQTTYEGFMPALLAIMEVPAVLIALFIAKKGSQQKQSDNSEVLHELLTGKGIVLLIGGLLVGMLTGKKGFEQVSPLFEAPFKGILCLFLLEVGLVTGRRLFDLKKVGMQLILVSLALPILNAFIGLWLAKWAGLSIGGSAIFAVLCASASYIAAPAAVRIALPEANPSYYLTSALAVVFPFNVTIGIPLYLNMAHWIYSL
ncbi:MAG: sodium-dependent bicarbonate transport family permease [Bacteroidia bacterium]